MAGAACAWCGYNPADPSTLGRGKERATLLRTESHTPATLAQGERMAGHDGPPCQPGSEWRQVAILDATGHRVALAFYLPRLDLLVDRISVW
jgi:hypothetical protein